MDAEQRQAERVNAAGFVRGSADHEKLLRLHERAGGHVHNVVVFGAVKICTECPQQWEVARDENNKLYWEPLPIQEANQANDD